MSGQADMQSAFAAALLDPARPVPEGVRSPWEGAGQSAHERRFAVYRNNVVAGLIDALASTYPAVEALVGQEFFRATAGEFVRRHPPRSPVLFEFGGELADFLEGFPPAATVPYLPDVARLEWAWLQAYHAADLEPADITLLGNLPPETVASARLDIHPSVAVIPSRFPVVSLWAETTGRAERSDLDLAQAETALVCRPADSVEVRAIAPAAAAFLDRLLDGETLTQAAEAANLRTDFDLASHLTELFGAGLVTGARITDDPATPEHRRRQSK